MDEHRDGIEGVRNVSGGICDRSRASPASRISIVCGLVRLASYKLKIPEHTKWELEVVDPLDQSGPPADFWR